MTCNNVHITRQVLCIGVYCAQTGCGDHPASYTWDKEGGSSGGQNGRCMKLILTYVRCPGCECMELYFHSPTLLYSVMLTLLEKDNFSVCGAEPVAISVTCC